MVETAINQSESDSHRPTDLTNYVALSSSASITPTAGGYEGLAFPGIQSLVLGATGRREIGIIRTSLGQTIGRLWTDLIAPIGVHPLAEPIARSDRDSITAVDAAYAVMDLFGVTMETLATITGIGRTTILNWRRSNALPRPSTVRELWRVYGLAVSLKSVLGAAGTRSWMNVGSPSPIDAMLAGELRSVERRVARLVFDPRQTRRFQPAVATEVEIDASTSATIPAAPASRGRARRAHLR